MLFCLEWEFRREYGDRLLKVDCVFIFLMIFVLEIMFLGMFVFEVFLVVYLSVLGILFEFGIFLCRMLFGVVFFMLI